MPKYQNRETWINTSWEALHGYMENLIPEGDESYDEQWNNICTAMAWIEETLTEGEE